MSKGLKTTAALGTMMIGILAMNAGAIAQSAGSSGSAFGQPVAEWTVGGAEGSPAVTFKAPRQETEAYREVTQGQSQATSYSGVPQAKPKNGARSGN